MPNNSPAKPLDGFRVLDFTQNVAGPLAGQVLADLGAEVIKIEAPGGEQSRRLTSVLPGRPPLATYFLPNNRGKKSVAVDLTTERPPSRFCGWPTPPTSSWKGFDPASWNDWAWVPTNCGRVTPN